MTAMLHEDHEGWDAICDDVNARDLRDALTEIVDVMLWRATGCGNSVASTAALVLYGLDGWCWLHPEGKDRDGESGWPGREELAALLETLGTQAAGPGCES
jgi:hypothetical protein